MWVTITSRFRLLLGTFPFPPQAPILDTTISFQKHHPNLTNSKLNRLDNFTISLLPPVLIPRLVLTARNSSSAGLSQTPSIPFTRHRLNLLHIAKPSTTPQQRFDLTHVTLWAAIRCGRGGILCRSKRTRHPSPHASLDAKSPEYHVRVTSTSLIKSATLSLGSKFTQAFSCPGSRCTKPQSGLASSSFSDLAVNGAHTPYHQATLTRPAPCPVSNLRPCSVAQASGMLPWAVADLPVPPTTD